MWLRRGVSQADKRSLIRRVCKSCIRMWAARRGRPKLAIGNPTSDLCASESVRSAVQNREASPLLTSHSPISARYEENMNHPLPASTRRTERRRSPERSAGRTGSGCDAPSQRAALGLTLRGRPRAAYRASRPSVDAAHRRTASNPRGPSEVRCGDARNPRMGQMGRKAYPPLRDPCERAHLPSEANTRDGVRAAGCVVLRRDPGS